MNKYIGLIYALIAYSFWGLVPIFWKQIAHVDSVEIVMHRMLWSCVLVVGLIVAAGQWKQLASLLNQPGVLLRLGAASIAISINWAVFIWAVNAGYLVEASMGYFINPLVNVLFGYFLFKEQLRFNHWLAITIVCIAVLYMIVGYGAVPYIALTLALSFGCYAALKKAVSIPVTHGMAVETAFMVIPASAYLLYLDASGAGVFGTQVEISVMLILAGLVTLIPLLFFSAAAKLISLTTLGISQYLGPSLMLLVGVVFYQEPFGTERLITFGLIWLAILIFTLGELKHQRQRRRQMKFPG